MIFGAVIALLAGDGHGFSQQTAQEQATGDITVSPTSLTFSKQILDTSSAPLKLTVKTVGRAEFHTYEWTPEDFRPDSDCWQRHPCTISVTFKPTKVGIRSGVLTVTATDTYKDHYWSMTIHLSGEGIAK